MKTEHPEVLVIGLGAMGSAVVYQLAKLGVKIIGIDQFTPPHAYGSTHGETRITRQAIGEGSQFVPLAMRSHQLWREIEAESGQILLTACGGLIMARNGAPAGCTSSRIFLAVRFAPLKSSASRTSNWTLAPLPHAFRNSSCKVTRLDILNRALDIWRRKPAWLRS